MILYLAGQAQEVISMKYKNKYEHVLFSKFTYTKENFKNLCKRKRKERKNESK